MVVLTLSMATLSMAVIAIFSMCKILDLKEQNIMLRKKLEKAMTQERMNILRQLPHHRRDWFIESFCEKDKVSWLKARNLLERR